ncbi:MAG: LamG domain-containing protein [Verrucomicrobiae bacterium]|nr:LamG domain-containing protein [Verrucomicrobiae bacterium]
MKKLVLACCAFMLGNVFLPARDIPMAGWWRFDEGSGTTVSDSSGNGNHGNNQGAVWTSGKKGAALYFDGIDNQVIVPNRKILNSPNFAISAWVYPETVSGQQAVFSKGTSGKKGEGFNFLLQNEKLQVLQFDAAGAMVTAASANVVVSKEWQQVGCSFNGESGVFYHNGQKCGEWKCRGMTVCNRHASIGRWCFGPIWPFHGAIDEVKFFAQALSAGEMAADFEGESSPAPEPAPLDAALNARIEGNLLQEDWLVKAMPGMVEASQFALSAGAWLAEDETAWDGVAATPNGGEHSNVFCSWTHLVSKGFFPRYLFIHFKNRVASGGGGSAGKRTFHLGGKKETWQMFEAGELNPGDAATAAFYGPAGLGIDAVFLAEKKDIPPEFDPDWFKKDVADGTWKSGKAPRSWKDRTQWERCGVALVKKKVFIPMEFKGKGGYFIFRTGDATQQMAVYLNGKKLSFLGGNRFGIPNSLVNYGGENLLALKVSSRLVQGCVVKGPVGLAFVPAPPLPEWTRSARVKKIAIGELEVLALPENGSPKVGDLCRLDFLVLEKGILTPAFQAEVFLSGRHFPTVIDEKGGDYTTWICGSRPGEQPLAVNLKTPSGPVSFSLGMINVQEGVLPQKKAPGFFPIGAFITPLDFENAGAEERHYAGLFEQFKAHGLNTLIVCDFAPGSSLNLVKKLAVQHGFHIVFYPLALNTMPLPPNPKQVYSLCKEVAGEWKDFPNLLAYGIWDEISMEQAASWGFIRSVMEALDPAHPATVCLNQTHLPQIQRLGAKVLHRDIYYGVPAFEKEVARAGEAAEKAGVPLWVTLASGQPVSSIRAQCWQSIAHGATGLFFFHGYAIYPKGNKWRGLIKVPDLMPEPQMAAVREVSEAIMTRLPVLPRMKSGGCVASSTQMSFGLTTRVDDQNQPYLFVFNREVSLEKSGEVALTEAHSEEISRVVDVLTGEEIKLGGRREFSCFLPPGGGKVYRLERLAGKQP